MWKPSEDELYFLPLGGSNEIGMNLNLYCYRGKWLMIDLGVGFADDFFPGVDILLPNVDFLLDQGIKIEALVLTHAHEDHFGAVPYMWDEFKCPVYSTKFTASVLKAKLAGLGMNPDIPMHEIKPGAPFEIGPFKLELVNLTHSIPEMHAVTIDTKQGKVLHTGDWKFDKEPMIGPASNTDALKKLGDEGVLAMVCDSTNVFVEGESGSESMVRKHLIDVVAGCKHRVAVTTFASNVARLESIAEAARVNNRNIVVVGRAMWRMIEAAKESGYLKDAPPFLRDREFGDLPRDEVLVMCTGSQGEPRAAISRIARRDHPSIRFSPGDTVIFSSREIPGNEKRIGWVENRLVEQGIEVIGAADHAIHVSGHPARDELSMMYQMVRPKISIPVHGEPRHLQEHCRFAKDMQVPHTVQGHNGAVMQIDPQAGAKIVAEVTSGYVGLDGHSLLYADSPVLRTRRKLRDEGAMFVTIAVDQHNRLLAVPQVSAPGILDQEEDADLLDALQEEIGEALKEKNRRAKSAEVKESARLAARRFIKQELGKKPPIEVHLLKM